MSGQHFQERRFSGPVPTDQSEAVTPVQCEGDVPDGPELVPPKDGPLSSGQEAAEHIAYGVGKRLAEIAAVFLRDHVRLDQTFRGRGFPQ